MICSWGAGNVPPPPVLGLQPPGGCSEAGGYGEARKYSAQHWGVTSLRPPTTNWAYHWKRQTTNPSNNKLVLLEFLALWFKGLSPVSLIGSRMLVLSKKEIPQYSKLLNVLFAIKTPCNCVNTWDFSPLSRGLRLLSFLGLFLGERSACNGGWGHLPAPPRMLTTGSFSAPRLARAPGEGRGECQGGQKVLGPVS